MKEDLENPSNFLEEYLLYEILFTPSQKTDLDSNKLKIEKSIREIGFENTANVLSEAPSQSSEVKLAGLKKINLQKKFLIM